MKYSTEEEIERKVALLYEVPERVKTLEDYEIPELLLFIENAILDVMDFGIKSSMFVKGWAEDLELREGGRRNMEKFEIEALKSVEQIILKFRDGVEPDANNIPCSLDDIEEMNTPEAKEIFKKAMEAGFLTRDSAGFKWKGTRPQLALFIDMASEQLKIKDKWKYFEPLFDEKYLAQERSKSLNTMGKVVGEDKIYRVFQ